MYTQLKIAAHLGIAKGTVQKILKNCSIIACSQSCRDKFFCFCVDGLYRRTVHPIDLQLELLLQNTLFFTLATLKDFLHILGGGSGYQYRNLLSTHYRKIIKTLSIFVKIFSANLQNFFISDFLS